MNARFSQVIALVLASLFLLSFIPHEVSAYPYKLQGYLKDGNGLPIPNANISISGEIYDMGTQDMATHTVYSSTNNQGYYIIYLAVNEPGGFFPDLPLTVSYVLEGEVLSSRSATIQGYGTWANLTYEEPSNPIDFFKSPIGVISVVALISITVIGYFFLRVPKEEKIDEKDDRPRVERRRRR